MLTPLFLLMPSFLAPQTPAGQSGPAASVSSVSDYKLVWADELKTNGVPDVRNWTFERGFVRNREEQWYQPGNARCEKGPLVIEARRDRVQNPGYDPAPREWSRSRRYAEFTPASSMTKGIHQWTCGRFEMRERIDTRPGLWPAFWTLGLARPWPGELQETFNQGGDKANPFREPHYILINLAIGGTNGGDPSGTIFPARFEVDYVRVYQKPGK